MLLKICDKKTLRTVVEIFIPVPPSNLTLQIFLLWHAEPTSKMVEMRYPYTFAAKFVRFPWSWTWKNGRFIRFTALSFAICFPMFYTIHKAVNSPENVAMWEDKRKHRLEPHFK
ncbi:uncharacterized protein LOC135484040 [Lineus longissimus]|uniref:uncharacterized protein LOC135484040 n=1 Tax=Lineus longissimus TaxID=88925 RepID=UPI00315C7B5A